MLIVLVRAKYVLKKEATKTNKRETALEVIRIAYAKYGKETRESMRAYVENRVSILVFLDLCATLKIFPHSYFLVCTHPT